MSEFLNQPSQEENNSDFDTLNQDRQLAERAKEKVFYAGIFIDRDELYSKFQPHLKNTVKNPHITTNFAPDETQLHLEELGSKAEVYAIGYGNNGKNEGLLVQIKSDNSAIQKAADDIEVPHITLSYSDDSHPMHTSLLSFSSLEKPLRLASGIYSVHLKDGQNGTNGPVVANLEELKKLI